MEKETEIKNLLEEGSDDDGANGEVKLNVEIDRILQHVEEEEVSIAEPNNSDKKEDHKRGSGGDIGMKVSRSRELFSDACVLNMSVPDPLK